MIGSFGGCRFDMGTRALDWFLEFLVYRGFRPPGMKHTFENRSSQRSQGCTNG
jgi:hypothetical protein